VKRKKNSRVRDRDERKQISEIRNKRDGEMKWTRKRTPSSEKDSRKNDRKETRNETLNLVFFRKNKYCTLKQTVALTLFSSTTHATFLSFSLSLFLSLSLAHTHTFPLPFSLYFSVTFWVKLIRRLDSSFLGKAIQNVK
jgi:hypothetical protein